MFVTAVVLAAGSSSRLGSPKQLLPYRGTTLLGATLQVTRGCPVDQLIVTLGAAGDDVRSTVDLTGFQVVDNPDFGSGCSSSIRSALDAVDERSDGLVLLLGDQPGVSPASVRRLVDEAGASPLGVCRYSDGLGHPFWFAREVFPDLQALHGDKGVWKLLESGRYPVKEVDVPGRVPLDVDTTQDYQSLLDQAQVDGQVVRGTP